MIISTILFNYQLIYDYYTNYYESYEFEMILRYICTIYIMATIYTVATTPVHCILIID